MVRLIKKEPELIKAIFSRNISSVRDILEENEDCINYRDQDKRTPLHAASYMGDPEIVRLLIECGARVNVKDSEWLYPLHRACATINTLKARDIVSILLDNDANINARDKHLCTCVHVAAGHNAVDCVSLIVNHNQGTEIINVSDRSGRTPLHKACQEGHLEMVQLLIQHGAKVNMEDKKDRRPVHIAALKGHIQILEVLVSAGANINARDKDKMTPLHIGAASGNLEVVATLLDMEATNINVRNKFGNTPAHLAALNGHEKILNEILGEGFDLNDRNLDGQTMIHLATHHNIDHQQDSCLSLLITEGANLDGVDNQGRTPFHLIARHGNAEAFTYLLKHFKDSTTQVEMVDKKGHTCLHTASLSANIEIVEAILDTFNKHGMDGKEEVNRPDFLGRSCLHLAAISGSVSIVKRLIETGGNVDMGDLSARTPLHAAAYSGSVECVELLLTYGADVTLTDNEGRLPLHYSSAAASISCLEVLMSAGSNPDLQDRYGLTALHLAAKHDNSGVCFQTLLSMKADPTITDNKGMNVAHYAGMAGNWASIQHLLEHAHSYLFNQFSGCDGESTTPVHLAAYNDHSEALILLLSCCDHPDLQDGAGRTPLYLAASKGHEESCVLLIGQGCSVSVGCRHSARTPLHAAAQQGHVTVLESLLNADSSAIDAKDSDGMTAALLAAGEGHLDCVKLLLSKASNPRIVDKKKMNILSWALVNHQESVAEYIIETIGKGMLVSDSHGRTACHLAAGTGQFKPLLNILDLDAQAVKWTDKAGFTPLHYASECGEVGALEVLMNFAKAGDVWSSNFSILHSAVLQDKLQCVKLIIHSWGTSQVDNVTSKGCSPLHTAASNNSLQSARFLVNCGAKIDLLDSKMRTPLSLAAKNGHEEMVQLLLEQKPNLSQQDVDKNTALHLASFKGHKKVCTAILSHLEQQNYEGDVNTEWISSQNSDGKTPLHFAAGKGMVETTKMLLMSDASVTLTDSEGNPPALCCAADDDTATCLAMILTAYSSLPLQESRKSLCSANSSRRSEMVQRLSEYFSDLDLTGNVSSPNSSRRSVNFGGVRYMTPAAENGHHDMTGIINNVRASLDSIKEKGTTKF